MCTQYKGKICHKLPFYLPTADKAGWEWGKPAWETETPGNMEQGVVFTSLFFHRKTRWDGENVPRDLPQLPG